MTARYSTYAFMDLWQRLRRYDRQPEPKVLATGVDGVRCESFEANLEINLNEISRRIERQDDQGGPSYRFAPLLKIELPKSGGGSRSIHIPRIRDQLVLRAMHDALIEGAKSSLDVLLRPPAPTCSRRLD